MIVPKRIHFVGIGGIGMSAIAKVLLEEGYEVSGSDLKVSPLTGKLVALGARVAEGHVKDNVGDAEMVVYSSAVPNDNPEVQEGLRRGIPVVKRADILSWLMARESRHAFPSPALPSPPGGHRSDRETMRRNRVGIN